MKISKLMQLLKDNSVANGHLIRSEADVQDGSVHVYVYDVIDSYWGASAKDLAAALASQQDKVVHLHINSPGGDVFEARAMAAAVVAHPNDVICHIDGIAASAATYLAMAGSKCHITDGGLFMIHNSWTLAMGDCNELRTTADLMEKIDGTINADYARKTGKSTEEVAAWMDAETWFTAQEALAAGFVDSVEPNTKKQSAENRAKWNLSAYANPPAALAVEPDLDEQVTQRLQQNRNRLRLFESSAAPA